MANHLTTAEHIRLWTDFRTGDRDAFDKLYTLFAADLYRYGYNLVRNQQVVEDCLHELFLHIHEHRQKLGPTDNIRFYLYRALRRRLLDTVTRLKRYDSETYLFDDAQFLTQPYEHALIESEYNAEQQQVMRYELERLPKRQKEILYLVYMKGLTYQQAAEVMDITMKSVYNTINIALTTLRRHVRESIQRQAAMFA